MFQQWMARLLVAASVMSFCQSSALAQLADATRDTAGSRWITRSVRLADLGIDRPVVLDLRDGRRDFYLPVPANVALKDASLRVEADYVLATGDENSLVLSLDGTPVAARAFKGERGSSVIEVGVDATPRPSGFVRVGLRWSAAVAAPRCTDVSGIGNLVTIRPDTVFTYRYDSTAVRDLRGAWSALAPAPHILVAPGRLSADAYDTAWRVGTALLRMGKRPVFRSLPQVGDDIDLRDVKVPAGLMGIPAFAALARGGVQRIGNAAQLGALLSLGERGPLRADILIDEPALREAMSEAFAALRAETTRRGRDMSFDEWTGGTAAADDAGEVRLVTVTGTPAIAVSAGAGAQAVALFRHLLLGLDGAEMVRLRATPPRLPTGSQEVPLSRLGAGVATVELAARAEWKTTFALSDVAGGVMPAKAVLDVSAAPSSYSATTVMSVFLNGILLGTRHLSAKGERERLALRIPSWAVGARNVLGVVFQREGRSADCDTPLETTPVSILPGSHLVFEAVKPQDDFTGMVSRFGRGAELIVPQAYLADAPRSLIRVVYVADAAGIAPERASMSVAEGDRLLTPRASFLAFDLDRPQGRYKATIDGTRLVLPPEARRVGMDVEGLSRVAVLEVDRVGGQYGILYRHVGQEPPSFARPFLLSRGDVAVVGADGLLTEIDSDGRDDGRLVASSQEAWLKRMFWWVMPAAIMGLFVLLLVAASVTRRRMAAKAAKAAAAAARAAGE